MKTIFKDVTLLVLASGALVYSLVGCESPNYGTPTPATTGATASARALFVNASPDAPALNFLVENVTAAQSLSAGQNSSYVTIPTGNIQLRASGASGAIGGTLGSNSILFRAGATNQNNFGAVSGTNYTVFVTDTIARPAPTTPAGVTNPGGLQFLTVTDPLPTTLAASASGVRFFHLAPDIGLPVSSTATNPLAVSVRLSAPGSTSAIASFVNRAYRNVAANAFTAVPAGTYRVDVFTGPTVPTSATVTPALSTTVNVEATKIYTLYAQGLSKRRTLSVGRVQHN